jgi:glycosyltransferase involved in cell wall biosynthesis
MIDLLRQADLVAAPSVPTRDGRREGIPVALREALACERPVVASRLSGIPELVIDGQTGLLTPPRDAAALAAALARLIEDAALRRRLAVAGRQTVIRDYHLHRNARRLAQHFCQRGAA